MGFSVGQRGCRRFAHLLILFEVLFELLEIWAVVIKAPRGLNASVVLAACPQTLWAAFSPGSKRRQEVERRIWK